MAEETIIREFRKDDLGAIVELSLRAWEPVFASLRKVLGDDDSPHCLAFMFVNWSFV